MGTVAKSEWDENSPTRVSDGLVWTARGLEDGAQEGEAYGPQPAEYWRLVAYFRQPGLSSAERNAYLEGFLRGVMVGIEKRQDALDGLARRGHTIP